MKFFIDTANLDEIREAEAMGVLDGVTTNPSLVSRESRSFEEILAEICEVVDGPISAEVTGTDFDTIMGEARHLAKFHDNIVANNPEPCFRAYSKMVGCGVRSFSRMPKLSVMPGKIETAAP